MAGLLHLICLHEELRLCSSAGVCLRNKRLKSVCERERWGVLVSVILEAEREEVLLG